MSSQASRESILKEIKSIRVGKEQQLRQVHVPENAYKMARDFLKRAPNFYPDHQPIRFKKLYSLSEGDTIYTLLIRDAGNTPLSGAKDKIVDWKAAVNAFTRYALNLLLAPNRPEFLRMKLSTSFYIYQVAKKLKEAEKILVCMGYVCSAEPYEVQEYKYAGDVKTEHIAEVLADLVILHSELDLIQGIVHGAINEKYVNVQLCDILAARARTHEDLGAALQSSASEAHRRMYARVQSELHHSPQLHRAGLRQSPQFRQAQHAATVPQCFESGQQYHQTTGPAAYYRPQNQWSQSSSPSMQRGTQNISPIYSNAEALYQQGSQNNLGVQAQTVPQQHVHQNVYHNIPLTGAQSTNCASPNLSQQDQLVNRDLKPQYAIDGKELNKAIPKQPNNISAPGASSKDPYNYYKGKVDVERRPHADSKPPDPMDLPDPVFDGNKPPPPPVEPYLSLMVDPRSVQSDLSGPNLDSMLSGGRSFVNDFQQGGPGYNDENFQTPQEKHPSPASGSQSSTHHPYCNVAIPSDPTVDPQPTVHDNELNSQEGETRKGISSPKCEKKPKPVPRHNIGSGHPTSDTKPIEISHDHAQTVSGTSVKFSGGDQSDKTELSKPHSSPHPSLEHDSAPPSFGAEHGQPDSGPQSNEEPSTPSADTKSTDNKALFQGRDRSNAISKSDQDWVCGYCTNYNSGATLLCEICGSSRLIKKETQV